MLRTCNKIYSGETRHSIVRLSCLTSSDNYKARRFQSPTGISLLEVLISIGVLAVGLMGVAALIPAAGFQAKEGARNERLANVGKRVFREIDVRGLLDFDVNGSSRSLMFLYGATMTTDQPPLPLPPFARLWTRRLTDSSQSANDYLSYGSSFCIDPLVTSPNTFINDSDTSPNFDLRGRTLPFHGPEAEDSIDRESFPNKSFPGMTRIRRLCIDGDPTTLNGVPYSERIAAEFTFVGDLLDFRIPNRKSAFPQQNYVDAIDPVTTNKFAVRRNNVTGLSWMIFCCPATFNSTSGQRIATFQVSVAIFENRNSYDREYVGRILSEDITNGGRNIVIQFPMSGAYKEKFTKSIKRNAWIGLGWQHPETRNIFYQWYTIANILELQAPPNGSSLVRQMQLKGADWQFPLNGTIIAVHVPKVVAVYTKVMPAKVR